MLEFDEKDELFVGDTILSEFGSCTECGICCKFFSQLPIYTIEIEEKAKVLGINSKEFQKKYTKTIKNSNKKTILSLKTPCPFLNQKICRIYANRFLVCRTFPLFINLTRNTAVLSGIYVCPQATQFYEGLLSFYKTNENNFYEQLIEKEKHIIVDKNGMELTGKAALFTPYLDWLHSKIK